MARSFEVQYPNIAGWVLDGWIEIGPTDWTDSLVRALDTGGLVWEGGPASDYASLNEALAALDAGIAEWTGAA